MPGVGTYTFHTTNNDGVAKPDKGWPLRSGYATAIIATCNSKQSNAVHVEKQSFKRFHAWTKPITSQPWKQ